MGHQFSRLESPDALARLAVWDSGKVILETITCPSNPGHQREGRRLTNLKVVLPNGPVEDVVWTWHSECLIQDRTLKLLRDSKLTGFDVKPVAAKFEEPAPEGPPRLWEVVVTGWAGMASSASGLMLDRAKSCAVCGHLTYTGLRRPENLIDESIWDGSDLFMVWPFPRLLFVSERTVDVIYEQSVTGVQVVSATGYKPVTDQFSPGRLSYWMPTERARQLGQPLGID